MSWSFDCNAESMQIIEILLYAKPKSWLIDAYMAYKRESGKLRKCPFRNDLEKFANQSYLVEICMIAIEDTKACSNGGFDVYIDSQGWYSVTLSDYDKLSPEKLDRLLTLAGYDEHSIPPQQITPFYDD